MKFDDNITWAYLALARDKRNEVRRAVAAHNDKVVFGKPYSQIRTTRGNLELQSIEKNIESMYFIIGFLNGNYGAYSLSQFEPPDLDEILKLIPETDNVKDVTDSGISRPLAAYREAYCEEKRRRRE